MTVHASPSAFVPAADAVLPAAREAAPLPVTVVRGDGIGPEIMTASLRVLEAAGANLAVEEATIGASLSGPGAEGGISPAFWDSLSRTKLLYKAPLATPQGKGAKSLNVTIRKTLGLYANIRPCVAHAPYVATHHPNMDVVVIRENEEDLYAGIEHRQTRDVVQCLKIVTRPGCERIARAAFEYARTNGRSKITCITKDNIMKMTDGLFRRVFEEVGASYPDISQDHMIVDIAAARLATKPESFDVILAPNLYGDILSDIAAEVAGSIGLAPSSNLGAHAALFEAVHGSAPDIAGRDIANPSGLLLAGAMMLEHAGKPEAAASVRAAWARTIRDGLHTADIAGPTTRQVLGTRAFADAVIERLALPAADDGAQADGARAPAPVPAAPAWTPAPRPVKSQVGADVFLDWEAGSPDALAKALQAVDGQGLTLTMITSRGVKVWPNGHPDTNVVDHWRCRFLAEPNRAAGTGKVWGHCNGRQVAGLMDRLVRAGLDVVKVEGLYAFDGEAGFSVGQGQ